MEQLYALLGQAYGAETASRIRSGYSAERPVTFRANTLKTSASEVIFALSECGITNVERVPWYRDAFILREGGESDLTGTELYREGKIYLQSLSSMLPPLLLQPETGENILDMTAAPGGKTTEIVALSGGKALVTACERDRIRFGRMKFNLERQGAARVNAMCCDASALDDFLSFDKILLDAPCTGSGTVSTSQPIRFTREYLAKCVRAQEKLLKKALRLLKKGGTLVYSTCSVLKEENELLLSRVLPLAQARLLPIEPFEGLPLLPSPIGTLAVCPTDLYEGFFCAKITK